MLIADQRDVTALEDGSVSGRPDTPRNEGTPGLPRANARAAAPTPNTVDATSAKVPLRQRWGETLPAVAGLVMFLVALEVLRVELRTVGWPELTHDMVALPRGRVAIAMLLTVLNYAVLTGYDLVAFAYIGNALPRARVILVSFLAYAVSNNVGFAMLSGASVRYRFYTRWGVTAQELSRIIFSYSVTFWLGLFALGGLSLIVAPLPQEGPFATGRLMPVLGIALMLVPAAYLVAAAVRRAPLRLWALELPLPSPGIAAAQFALSTIDWILAGAVLFALLPPSPLSFFHFMGAFLAAILLGMVSHVPGGLGVFEGTLVLLLKPYLDSASLLPSLVLFRVVYYLLPLSIALLVAVADEVRRHRRRVARVGAVIDRIVEEVSPRLLAAFTFLGGVVLLFSGATPAAQGRLSLISWIVPLGVIEASHFLASVAGVGLLVLSQGLARRLDVAYFLAVWLLSVGAAASLLKAFDYEEAVVLMAVLVLLHRAKPAFYRRGALFDTRFSPTWIASVIGAFGASVWLGLFAFQHVQYSHDLWWQFAIEGEASRYLRASVGAAVALLVVAITRLLGYAPHETPAPSADDLRDAERVIALQPATLPHLVFLRDKALLFDEDRSAFVMYAVHGRTWVALGDPVGSSNRVGTLIQRFLERCDDFGGVPVFYEVTPENLHRYADFGMAFVKLGEEAKVDLRAFALEGQQSAKFRHALNRLERERSEFRIVDAPDVAAILPQLRGVSDDWLAAKSAAEKGFSLGFFDDEYICRFPVAVIEREGRIQAFANLWLGGTGKELSVDLMRHSHDAPGSTMDALFVHLMRWGKEHGYDWLAMGMAPLSGFEQSPVASLWSRLGSFVYQHGESLYNFQGLRAYKGKFKPLWEPRYLAYPGGLHLPRVLADVAALIAGGYRHIFLKRSVAAPPPRVPASEAR